MGFIAKDICAINPKFNLIPVYRKLHTIVLLIKLYIKKHMQSSTLNYHLTCYVENYMEVLVIKLPSTYNLYGLKFIKRLSETDHDENANPQIIYFNFLFEVVSISSAFLLLT